MKSLILNMLSIYAQKLCGGGGGSRTAEHALRLGIVKWQNQEEGLVKKKIQWKSMVTVTHKVIIDVMHVGA